MTRTKRRGKVARKSRVQTRRNNAMKPRVQTRRNNAVKKSVRRKRPRRSRGKMKGGEEPEGSEETEIHVEPVTPDACPTIPKRFENEYQLKALVKFLNNVKPEYEEYKNDLDGFINATKSKHNLSHGAEIGHIKTVLEQLERGPIKLSDEAITIDNVHDWAQNNFYINRLTDPNTIRFFNFNMESISKDKREYEIIFPDKTNLTTGKPRGVQFKIKNGVLGTTVYKISCSE